MLLALVTAALAGDLQPGVYGDLRLGVDLSSHEVTGAFFSGTGDDGAGHPQFTCAFSLRGARVDGRVTLTARSGDTSIPGTLTFDADSVTVTLRENPDGCGNVQPFVVPARFTRDTAQPWVAIRNIGADRAWFADAPDSAPRKQYVVKGDVVAVFEAKGKSVRAAYTSATGRVTTGWIPVADLAPLP